MAVQREGVGRLKNKNQGCFFRFYDSNHLSVPIQNVSEIAKWSLLLKSSSVIVLRKTHNKRVGDGALQV